MVGKAKSITCDVVVVGAGLVGLAAAIALTEQGKHVVIVDAKQKKINLTKAWDTRIYALTPATEKWLEALEVWPLVNQTRINPVDTMSLWTSGSSDVLNLFAEDANCEKLACIIENKNLMQALWQRLERLDVETIMGHPCLSVDSLDEHVDLHLEGGYTISAQLLVAADGTNSFVRKQLAITTKVKPFNQLALVANYLAEINHGNVARQWFSSHTTLALLPLPANHVSLVWSLPMELAQTLLGLTSESLAGRVQHETEDVLGKLKPVSETLSFELQQVTANRLIGNRVIFVGDAAHQVHPMAGQGANLGFRDVISLQTLIGSSHQLQDIGEKSFIRRYERSRKADVLSMNTLTSGLDHWFSNESKTANSITQIGIQQLNKHSSIKQLLIKQAVA
jgi:2-polyprenylphenol 6-hydroxylase